MCSTGSPLAPESFDYVYAAVKEDLCLASISGGTDLVSCFALGDPIEPVWRGELQCRGLGMRVEVWNERGEPVRETKGELVCTAPFVTMPLFSGTILTARNIAPRTSNASLASGAMVTGPS